MGSPLEDRMEYLKYMKNQLEKTGAALDQLYEFIPCSNGVPTDIMYKFHSARLELITQLSTLKFFKRKECMRISNVIDDMRRGVKNDE